MTTFQRFLKDESGATAIEYGLLAALLSVMVIAGAKIVGTNVNTMFGSIGTTMQQACIDAKAAAGPTWKGEC